MRSTAALVMVTAASASATCGVQFRLGHHGILAMVRAGGRRFMTNDCLNFICRMPACRQQ